MQEALASFDRQTTHGEPTYVLCAVFQMLLRAGGALGLDRQVLLATTGLGERALADRDARIPSALLFALGRAILSQRPNVNVSLVALEQHSLATLGVLGYALQNSERLGDALELFVRYQQLFSNMAEWTVDRSSGRVRLDTAMRGPGCEVMLGQWVTLSRQLVPDSPPPVALRFIHRPLGDPREHEAFFGCPVSFGAHANELVLRPQAMTLPLPAAQPAMVPGLLPLLESKTGRPGRAFTARVQTELRRCLARGGFDKARIARALGVSARTLNRRLHAEGTTYRDVLSKTRAAFAKACLAHRDMAAYEVASLLGYTEPSAFFRAFRRWTGQTPEAWRLQARQDGYARRFPEA